MTLATIHDPLDRRASRAEAGGDTTPRTIPGLGTLRAVTLPARLPGACREWRVDAPADSTSPTDTCGVVGLDLNPLGDDEAVARAGLAALLNVCGDLDAPYAAVGFLDRVVSLPRHGAIYLHMPITLKRPDEPAHVDVWSRLRRALEFGAGLSGEPACHHGLQVERMLGLLGRGPLASVRCEYVAPRTPAGHARATARRIEALFHAAEARHGGTWTYRLCLPRELIAHGNHGSPVAKGTTTGAC